MDAQTVTAVASAVEFDCVSLCEMTEVKSESTRQFWRELRLLALRTSEYDVRCSDYMYTDGSSYRLITRKKSVCVNFDSELLKLSTQGQDFTKS